MLVLLKIPIVYLCMVWWAIRAEPRDEQPAVQVPVSDTPTRRRAGRAPRPGRRPGPSAPRAAAVAAVGPRPRGEARR